MNKNKISCIRNILVKRMTELIESSDNTIKKLKITDEKFADPFDQAAFETSKNVDLNCRIKNWNLLLDIKETILRIDRGLFGICDHCGRRISQKRLKVEPMTKLCIECKKKIEIRQNAIRQRSRSNTRVSYNHV
ncbi:c4-type zinc finger protein, dksa/trar family [hydrocarbon metagenome]|uniref:C4-type zinc finger protein, dksa/trar family n=1 Tax=hydrocarbon metagenome TaxID=938273 RepID=A0A0W8FPE0_9ZZZZ